jgi:hypothetical protein
MVKKELNKLQYKNDKWELIFEEMIKDKFSDYNEVVVLKFRCVYGEDKINPNGVVVTYMNDNKGILNETLMSFDRISKFVSEFR